MKPIVLSLLVLSSLLSDGCADDASAGPDASPGCSVVMPPPTNVAPADRLVDLSKAAGEATVFLPLESADEGRQLRVFDTRGYGDWLSGSLLFVGPEPERRAIYGSAGLICAADFAALTWIVPPGAAGVILDLNPRGAELFVTAMISDRLAAVSSDH